MRWTLHNATKALAALLVLSGCLVSCGKDDDKAANAEIELIVKSNPVEKNAGSQFITIKTDGVWELALTYQGSGSDWISLDEVSGDGSQSGGGTVLMKYEANTADDQRTVTITAFNSKYSTSIEFTQKGTKEARYGSKKAAQHWLELPETMEDDDFDFFTHSMVYNSKEVRNYSFYWDTDNLVANWVAYPMIGGYTGNSGRSDQWGIDPLLPSSDQPVLISAFRDSYLYARGHQIPSADRTFIEKSIKVQNAANITTFYGTNMTPQLHDFNSGVWEQAEKMVRIWANACDTLYVVTGCVTTGSTSYTYDNYSKKVTVPTAYFKAVLRLKRSSTDGYNGYIGCGFYMPHSTSTSAPSKSNALSISELESKLGYSLFVNLPEVVGEESAQKIKEQKPSSVSWWWSNN